MSDPALHSSVPQISTRIATLTSIRGVAAWWVVLYHFRLEMPPFGGPLASDVLGHGYLAVDLFFILSGFVIALNYTASFTSLTAKAYRRFLGLRLARVYPLHLVMMLLFLCNPLAIMLFSHHGDPGGRYDPVYYVLSLLLVQNWGFVSDTAWNVPAWSISTEWAAYLLFPLLAWGVAPRLRSAAGGLAVVAGALAVLVAGAARAVPGLGADIATFGLFRCLTEFAAGAGLFWAYQRRPATASAGGGTMWLLAAAALVVAAVLLALPDFLLIPPAFALLIYGLSRQPRWADWLLGWRALELLGTVSYSTYLAHYFVRDWVKFLLVGPGKSAGTATVVYLAATALASVLLYRWIELPGRRVFRAVLAGPAYKAALASAEP